MQFQVPQFIDTEDKIVGPLSLKQFGYVAAAGMVSALFYFFTQPWLWVVVSILVFSLAIALAFVKVSGRPFATIVIAAFNYYWHPQTYIWQPEKPVAQVSVESVKAEASRSGLEEILAKSVEKMKATMQAKPKSLARMQSQLQTQPKLEPQPAPAPISREAASAGAALHKSWEDVQTGAPLAKKTSDKEFLEKKMAERYQIFRRISGEQHIAKRVDYR